MYLIIRTSRVCASRLFLPEITKSFCTAGPNSRTLIHVLTFPSRSLQFHKDHLQFGWIQVGHPNCITTEHFTRMTAYVYASNIYEAVTQMSVNADFVVWVGIKSFCDQDYLPIFQLPFQFLVLFAHCEE